MVRGSEHTRQLPQLKVGDTVRIQNQVGNYPRRWDKTGTVVEVRQHDQYVVKVDGSGRATVRNRRFLRQYTPVVPRNIRRESSREAINDPIPSSPKKQSLVETCNQSPTIPQFVTPEPLSLSVTEGEAADSEPTQVHRMPTPQLEPETDEQSTSSKGVPVNAPEPEHKLRRSTRERRQKKRLIDEWTAKSN